MVPSDPQGTAVELTERRVGRGPLELPHRRHLGHRHVVEDTERADHDSGEQESPWVDLGTERVEVRHVLVAEPGEVREREERAGERGGDREAGEGREQRSQRREPGPVGEEKCDERRSTVEPAPAKLAVNQN